ADRSARNRLERRDRGRFGCHVGGRPFSGRRLPHVRSVLGGRRRAPGTVGDGSYCSASGEIHPWITKNCPRFLATFLARRLPSALTVSQVASAAAEVMPLTTADVKRFPANPPAPIISAMPGL